MKMKAHRMNVAVSMVFAALALGALAGGSTWLCGFSIIGCLIFGLCSFLAPEDVEV